MRQDPQRGRSPQEPVQGETVHGSSAEVRRGPTEHGSTATMTRQVREEPPRQPPPPPHRPRFNPLMLLGLLGLLALAGLVTGLVVSHNPTPVRHVVPTPAPTHVTRTLGVFAMRGSGTSTNFVVPTSPVVANYGYQCPAGTTGPFIARMSNASGSDTQTIVNSTATTGSRFVTLHPRHVGSPYHFNVTAPSPSCGYRISAATP